MRKWNISKQIEWYLAIYLQERIKDKEAWLATVHGLQIVEHDVLTQPHQGTFYQ